ncbi:hypothetical protein BC941DRAFT_431526 [Chlamydoabsidia padenii]|nr:hypothetical protein BC941DRAFT_431526 [Chlamydoabsidia padenii]
MITDMTTNYNQQHISSPNFKTSVYMTATGNGAHYYQQGTSPSMGHQQVTQAMPMAMPMMNHPMPMQQPQPTFFPSPVPSRPSPVGYGYNEPDPQTYCNYLYQVGFLQGNFSDITVSVPSIGKSFTLHSLILSRSPYLYQRLMQLENDATVIELDYKGVMAESFHTIFTHLYRPLTHQDMLFLMNEKPQLYLELIGLADYLELPLKELLMHVILTLGFNNEAMRWVHYLQPYAESTRMWVKTLDDRLLQYLTRGLSTQLEAFSTSVKMSGGVVIGKNPTHGYMTSKTIPLRGMTDLAKLYATLPWIYLKRCLEHPDLPVQDTIHRYFFTKKVLQLRSAKDEGVITVGLRFDGQAQQQQQQQQQMPNNKKKFDDKDSMVMTLSLVKTPRRKQGKWDPSLYEVESDDSDEEP